MAPVPSPLNRFLFHPLQALAALLVFSSFRLLPFEVASAVGGWIARTIGPRLTVSHRAVRNLERAFPEKDSSEIAAIVSGMWDNLGRLAGEYPHLSRVDVYAADGPVEIVGAEFVDQLRDDGKPGIFFSAHIANWEIVSLGATQRGLPLDRVYRAANNPLVEWLFQQGRSAVDGALIPKGSKGARQLLKSIKDGNHLGLLVDQKMNDGIPVPFFGRDAMTAPALAELALRFDCPVVPARVERLKGPRFRLVVEEPLKVVKSGNRQDDVLALMTAVNARIEKWVRANPSQWLWVHNRWPD